jgi:hypothetical protein
MNKLNKSDMVIYNDGELELNVSVTQDTLWLTQKQIAELFENRIIQKYLIVQQETIYETH